MAEEAIPDLKAMSKTERAEWYHKRLLQLPGTVRETQGKRGPHWLVLDHQGSLGQLMVELSSGQLSRATCNDVNLMLASNGWRTTEWAGKGSGGKLIHSILMFEDEPADDPPVPPPADPAGVPPAERVGIEPEDETVSIEPDDLLRAADVLRWAAGEIQSLRERIAELTRRNAELEGAASRQHRYPATTTSLFHDGLAALSDLRQE